MTSNQWRLVIFGDQTSDISSLLKTLLLQVPQSAAQTDFIRAASAALRAQADSLRPCQRSGLAQFRSIHDLADVYCTNHGRCHAAINGALLCVTQLLQLFRYFESGRRMTDLGVRTFALGLCTGSLAAAAFAASGSLEDLRLLAAPVVSMAFQLGVHAATVGDMLYQRSTQAFESWAVCIPDMTEDDALEALEKHCTTVGKHGLPQQCRCYISAVGPNWVSISGPPHTLRAFVELLATSDRRAIKSVWLPIFAPYHTSYVYPAIDFTSFWSHSGVTPAFLASFKLVHECVSGQDGKHILADNALELFEAGIQASLQAPVRLDLIIDSLASRNVEGVPSAISIDIVNPVPVTKSLVTALSSRHNAAVSSQDLLAAATEDSVRNRCGPSSNNEHLAIVGMSGRFPDADSAEALWKVLSEGKDTHQVVPQDRFDPKVHVDTNGRVKNAGYTPYGCFIKRPGDFDPKFFNMSPKEALQTDPAQRLALVTAYEALEQAGFVPNRTRSSTLDRVGTFYGQASDDYRDVNASQDIGTYFITGCIRAFAPGRINYFFKFSGPSYSVDTACSSSLAAIQLACTAIWNGECDVAVAGGLSVLTSPEMFCGLSRGQFLSKTGSCKTFDNKADGYCRADGIGTVVIKRLGDATLDRDKVLIKILGAATNHSAQAISITHPHAESQARLYRQVLRQAGVDPHDVGYIEMHGTGTQAGDGTEMRSVAEVFAQPARSRDNPLYVGAAKANVGHSEASSGVVSLIKSIMVMQKGVIPPHVGIKGQINANFPDLQALNIRIASRMTQLPASRKPRTMLVNNFSAAGGNTALLIQEAPAMEVQPNDEPRQVHPVTVSGHTYTALMNNLDNLVAFLEQRPDTSPLDLSYTTTARRVHHAFRATVVGASTGDILVALSAKRDTLNAISIPKGGESVVFTFTGQGAAYAAMAREIYSTSTQFRADLRQFDDIARQQGFPSFLPIIDGTVTNMTLLTPVQSQIGHVCLQIALARLWVSFGIKPSAVVGHSLGEYAALHVAGVLAISDTINLVGSRARLLEEQCEMYTHGMIAVQASDSVVKTISQDIAREVDLACENTPHEVVYAGPKIALDEMAAKLSEKRVRHTQLRVPYAFHSAQVEPVLQDFEELAGNVRMAHAHTTVISSTLGRVMTKDEKIDAVYLSRHCRQAVRFKQAIQHAQKSGIIQATTAMVEIGPNPICSGMVKSTLGDEARTFHTLKRQQNPWTAIVDSLVSLHDAGFKINWSEYYRDFERSCRLIHLPAYAFDMKNYWIEYKNNWTLRKGEALPSAAPLPESTKRPLISSSVHRVVEDRSSTNDPVVVFESDLFHAEMHTAISGHRVNGASLCPSSLYADIALTIANYIRQAPESGFFLDGYDVCNMEVHKPLLVAPDRKDERKVLRMFARVNRAAQCIDLEYHASDTKHASCNIAFGDPQQWLKRWAHHLHFVDDRIRNLDDASENGKASTITKRLAYRLFANLVDYSSRYHRMTQVVFDSEGLEATAIVSLDPESDKTGFAFSPYNLDGLLHLSGLILNGNETFDHTKAVYISHGWESLRLGKPLRVDADYKAYVKMLPTGKNMVAGNICVISANEIVAVCEGVRFQQVPRAVLNLLLPPADHRRTQTTISVEAPEKTPQATPNLRLPSADHNNSQAVTSGNQLEEKILPTARPITPPKTPPTASRQLCASLPQHVTQPPESSKGPETKRCLEVLATEIGFNVAEISPSDSLAELGVDSLMSLALAGRLKSECDIDIDHSRVMTCDTVADLLAHVTGKDNARSACDSASPPLVEDSRSIPYPPTPPLDESLSDSTIIDSEGTSTAMESSSMVSDKLALIRTTIIDETGIEPESLDLSTDLANLGVDSLMNLAILSKLRDQGVDLPTSFFLEHQTLEQVQKAITRPTTPPAQPQPQVVTPTSPSSPPPTSEDLIARHILLQKPQLPTSTSHKTLFLFPDGSGSPYAYTAFSHLHPSFTTYGLTSPFHSDASAYTCGLEAAVRIYLRTIKSIQPHGPYYLGGWSVGGVLAFEAARQLGDGEVGGLLLIDAPCPLTLPPMNSRLVGFLEAQGVFEGFDDKSSRRGLAKKEKVLRHFEATVENLGRYRPRCISTSADTLILWAREGVLRDEDRDGASEFEGDPTAAWVLEKRGEASDHGWRDLLPQADIEVVSVPGNHFSMMTGDHVSSDLGSCGEDSTDTFRSSSFRNG
ncbi:Conidial yellow pigment biosynthesis polyketide synthase [Teratosphaeria destructans]|uniref:Conidial yellow pigment biosynthesis polyketide synthase n=1 Tax=Teratosphaeria destructans TaxID=418781 RepID=A0A9W7W0F9_9PEZI|nr:Conidial yellow pigment biosynthesis polyketide synthase [Teratosphaeria destructans]